MVVIVGHSRFGKSTLLSLTGLLDRLSSGMVLVNDFDATKLSESDRTALQGSSTGFVFRTFRLVSHRSVAGNAALAGLYQDVSAEERKKMSRRAIDLADLDHRSDPPAGLLSSGERQRVAIVRAVAVNPVILPCDEPTGSLDGINPKAIIDLLTTFDRAGTTVMIVTYNPEIASVGNLRLRLHGGVVTHDTA